ncbi:MAG: sigma-70 family RNA polymerase sigma factor [Acidobacteriota bacterium]|nr:sigma-70 family RNA polymerase sigma factor [Acidobacteriota bacterium]
MGRALEGSQEAYHDIVVRYQRPVFTVVLRMVRDPQLAEDLTQESFIKAFRALATFDPSRKLASWLFKIAHNTTLDHLRRRSLDTVPLEPGEDEAPDRRSQWADPHAESPEHRASMGDLAEAIEAALDQLRPEYREIVVLRYQEGLAYQEIAEILDLPMGTVKTHIHRSRRQLAEILSEEGWSPGALAAEA